jgi:KRAB domain-containing zinc finger protein
MRPENEVTEEPKPATVKKPAREFIPDSFFKMCYLRFCFLNFTALMKCQQCNKMILVSRMKTHLKVHSGVKPHLCELCGRAFVFKSSLNSHIRINHGKEAKPFMCSTCGYTCRRKQLLDNHERIHTNERVRFS